jgi:hypothetical protein
MNLYLRTVVRVVSMNTLCILNYELILNTTYSVVI